MSDTKVFSIADLRDKTKSHGTKFSQIEVWGGTLRLGTISSAAVLKWVEENENPDFQKTSGLRLLARTIVDDEGNRVSSSPIASEQETNDITEFVNTITDKDAEDNGNAVLEALKLNNLLTQKLRDRLKNGSGETTTEGLPSVSPEN